MKSRSNLPEYVCSGPNLRNSIKDGMHADAPLAGLCAALGRTGACRRSDRLARNQTFALSALAGELACATNGLCLLTGLLFGRLLVMPAKLHFPEDAFPLHLLLQGLEGLVDVIVADENLHALYPMFEVAR